MREAVEQCGGTDRSPEYSNAGMNWENVNKRILPQLIYKGHVLRREELCRKGLFFVCPKHVNGGAKTGHVAEQMLAT